MAELSAYAVQILEHLKKDREFKSRYDPAHVEALFHQWDNYVRRISFFNRYPDMTDHGPSHANSVVSLVAQIAIPARGGREKAPLNGSELFCLTGAAWLHDIGMYTTGELDVFDPERVRASHCCLSRDKMRDEREILFPGLPEGDVKLISAIAAYHQSRTALDEAHRKDIAKAKEEERARKERQRKERGRQEEQTGKRKRREKEQTNFIEGMPTLEEELRLQGFESGSIACLERLLGPEGRAGDPATYLQPIRMKLLAALIRLLDQSDIQMIRAGNLDFLVRRVDRSIQQRNLYARIANAIGDDPGEGQDLWERLDREEEYFSETHKFYLRDFWVERTLIVPAPKAKPRAEGGEASPGGEQVKVSHRIYIKMNDKALVDAQLELVPPSLQSTKDAVQKATLPLEEYLKHAVHYVHKELDLLHERYLQPQGLGFEVVPYPTEPKERHALQRELRSRSPYHDASPDRPAVYERAESLTPIAAHLAAGKEKRVLVVYGPEGRGRRQFALSLAEAFLQKRGHGDLARIWWNVIEKESPVQDAVHDAGSYLASLGEYALFNVVHDENLVGEKHVRFCLDLVARGDVPEVVVLDGLNRVDTRFRPFFRDLLRALEGKLVIAVTTRWPSPEAAGVYFESIEGQTRFLECPRLSRAAGRKVLARLASGAQLRGAAAQAWVDEWASRWEAWGREGFFLDTLSAKLWLATENIEWLPSIVEGAIRAETTDRLAKLEKETKPVVLEAIATGGRGPTDGSRVLVPTPNPAIQNLVDRGLARWETTAGRSPWPEDDQADLLAERLAPREAVWLHPAFGRCFSRLD